MCYLYCLILRPLARALQGPAEQSGASYVPPSQSVCTSTEFSAGLYDRDRGPAGISRRKGSQGSHKLSSPHAHTTTTNNKHMHTYIHTLSPSQPVIGYKQMNRWT